MKNVRRARDLLLEWYDGARRDLPWRRTRDPWRILVSEVMCQQTRVAAVIPYYERFFDRFPTPAALLAAPEAELLAAWSGLGYYTRARNLRKAAGEIVAAGAFPNTHEAVRALPGVGDYTAAALASISFDLPHAVLDGNVIRVLARFTADRGDIRAQSVKAKLRADAQQLLDPERPGDFNQALMELGALVCLPKTPQCLLCPWRELCKGRRDGIEMELPIRGGHRKPVKLAVSLAIAERKGAILLRQRGTSESRLAGFWELPELADLPRSEKGTKLGQFRHSITHHNYTVEVWRVAVKKSPAGFRWFPREEADKLPLTTMARKALKTGLAPQSPPSSLYSGRNRKPI